MIKQREKLVHDNSGDKLVSLMLYLNNTGYGIQKLIYINFTFIIHGLYKFCNFLFFMYAIEY